MNHLKNRSPAPGWPENSQYRLYSAKIALAASSRTLCSAFLVVSRRARPHAAAHWAVTWVSRRFAAMSTLASITTRNCSSPSLCRGLEHCHGILHWIPEEVRRPVADVAEEIQLKGVNRALAIRLIAEVECNI